MSFCTAVADVSLQILVFRLHAVVVRVQFVVLLLEVDLVAVADFLVRSVLLVAVALDAQGLVFVVQLVEPAVLLLDLRIQVFHAALVLVEVVFVSTLFFLCVDLGEVFAEVIQQSSHFVEVFTSALHVVLEFHLDLGALAAVQLVSDILEFLAEAVFPVS